MRVLFLFIDGLGLGKNDPTINPCVQDSVEILRLYENGRHPTPLERGGFLVPTEANLGVEGLPQSATGQTALFTGVNTSRLLKRHLQGFPNETLREVLREKSLLKTVKGAGLRSAFINAYRPLFFKLKPQTQWRLSTTTVANLSAGNSFFEIEDIRRGRSLYHDFTNATLIRRGFDVPPFSPKNAAEVLVRASEKYHLCLYEFFLTDRAGHSQNMAAAAQVIRMLDQLLLGILSRIDLKETLVLLTSDHGNVEDLSVKTHTRNRVPTLLWGKGAEIIKNVVRSIEDIAPALSAALKKKDDNKDHADYPAP